MSTRSQIGIYDEVVVGGDPQIKPEVMLYVHSDGYPHGPHGIPARLGQIIPRHQEVRPWWDASYLSAQVCAHMVMGLRDGHIRQAKHSIKYHKQELAALRRKQGPALHNSALRAALGLMEAGKSATHDSPQGEVMYHLKHIEEDKVRVRCPVTEIYNEWDVLGVGIVGDRAFTDYAYYYAVMPDRIRVYECNSPRDLLLTSEPEAKALFKGKLPKRWTQAAQDADYAKWKAMDEDQRDKKYHADARRIERRSAKLYAALAARSATEA